MMTEAYPKISIVTPTYNQGEFIEQTIKSVLDQQYPNLEYIIIDGGSTDNTVEIIKKYSQHLKYWVSEEDNGQANAINKGLQHCTGEIFNWLNSDDYLEAGALKTIAQQFASGASLVAGAVRLFDQAGTIELVEHKKLTTRGLMYWEQGVQFVQPGVWLLRKNVIECGGIDERLHYCFDWDLYIRYLNQFPRVDFTSKLLIHFRYHEQSKTVSMQQKFREEQEVIIENFAAQNKYPSLKQLAKYKLANNNWMPFLQNTVNNGSMGKMKKINTILAAMRSEGWLLWRPTAGAIKMILSGAKY